MSFQVIMCHLKSQTFVKCAELSHVQGFSKRAILRPIRKNCKFGRTLLIKIVDKYINMRPWDFQKLKPKWNPAIR